MFAAPSANTSGRPSPTRASHVREDLEGKIDMIIDGGQCGNRTGIHHCRFYRRRAGNPSPGYINQEMMEDVIGQVKVDRGLLITDENVRPKAPGMKYRHYAPQASLTIVEGKAEDTIAYINTQCGKAESRRKRGRGYRHRRDQRKVSGRCGKEHRYQAGRKKGLPAIFLGFSGNLMKKKVDAIFSESFDTPKNGTGDYEPAAESGQAITSYGCENEKGEDYYAKEVF